ncbi:hypothetical protein M2139_001496 [Enterococcus sp. PF1-24]|uniref:hypothetical protein n=1 Tax=unclassified Enterococcus TaxID=2608891 RepID=UPI00247415DA|nr:MULTISPECIES: hypothetical protein [unclassified Enterococcus]MDH6364513.1 hypothetical protein [Enterococcus sp. PFB1-1]MDH6401610.1 hypothetical protein [Enterococcus sp. PF1-24]
MYNHDLLKRVLVNVLSKTYENYSDYEDFSITVTKKELGSKDSCYYPNDRKIEIYNISRPYDDILYSCIYEIARHVAFIDEATVRKNECFYKRLHKLLLTAFSFKLLDIKAFEEMIAGTKDIDNLVKYFGNIKFWKFEQRRVSVKQYVIVHHAYKEKKALKQRNYEYHANNRTWAKVFASETEAQKEVDLLKYTLCVNKEYIMLGDIKTLMFSDFYYLIVAGAYKQKDFLWKNNYKWQGFGFKGSWVKQVSTQEYINEVEKLKIARLVFKLCLVNKVDKERS